MYRLTSYEILSHSVSLLIITICIQALPFITISEERSQLANKIKAMSRLKAKLLVIAVEQRASEIKQIRGDVVKAEWGQQIRNYVFHPYKLVKDVRTGHETSDVASVMDGELQPFIKAYLKYKYTTSNEYTSVKHDVV